MTDSVGRHAAGRESAETLIIPAQQAQQAWLDGEGTGDPGPRPRAAGRHASNGTGLSNGNGIANGNGLSHGNGTADLHSMGIGNGPAPRPERHQPAAARGDRQLRLVWVYPDLLSTYGDRGNLLVLS